MNNEILEAIQKTLPAMQMDALRAELEKARNVDKLNSTIKEKDERIKALNEQVTIISNQFNEANNRAKKTDELAEQERNLKLKELEYKLDAQYLITQNVKDLAMAAFRNPTIHKTFSSNGYTPGGSTSETTSETTTID